MSDEIAYFKIQNAFLPTWTLKQASHLLLGYDPLISTFKIGKDENNKVSNLYYFLSAKSMEGTLNFVDRTSTTGKGFLARKSIYYYSVDQFFECLDKNGREYDQEIYEARQCLFSKKINTILTGKINTAMYRQAARIIWKAHPGLHGPQVAEELENLPQQLQKKYQIDLKPLQKHQIQEYLKSGLSPHKKGAPKKASVPKPIINWDFVLENM